MAPSTSNASSIKENVIEGISKIASWITTQLATYMLDPKVGTALSLIFISIFALRKFKKAIIIRKKEKFIKYIERVKNKIIELQSEIEKSGKLIPMLQQAHSDVKEEYKRISIEEQLRTEDIRLKELVSIKLYYETILRAIRVVEPLRHKHGDKVDEIYQKIIDLSNKAVEGKITEKDVKKVIEIFDSLIDNVPDFPQVLLEIAEEKLK